jgi:hypothetical protein
MRNFCRCDCPKELRDIERLLEERQSETRSNLLGIVKRRHDDAAVTEFEPSYLAAKPIPVRPGSWRSTSTTSGRASSFNARIASSAFE